MTKEINLISGKLYYFTKILSYIWKYGNILPDGYNDHFGLIKSFEPFVFLNSHSLKERNF